MTLLSFNYPPYGQWSRITSYTPKKYGFNERDSCDNYEMDNPDTSTKGVKYQTEHVLEWQLVGDFFTQMGKQIKTKFDHPNPTITDGEKIGFCTYWKESWDFTRTQVMEGLPVVAAASPSPGAATGPTPTPVSKPGTKPVARKPFELLALEYPYKDKGRGGAEGAEKWLEEFTLLERVLNGENKNAVRTSLVLLADGVR